MREKTRDAKDKTARDSQSYHLLFSAVQAWRLSMILLVMHRQEVDAEVSAEVAPD